MHVLQLTSNSFFILLRGVHVDHMCSSRKIFSSGKLEFSKKVPVRNDVTFWQPFLGHRKHSPSGYFWQETMRQLHPHAQSLVSGSRDVFLHHLTVAAVEFSVWHMSA